MQAEYHGHDNKRHANKGHDNKKYANQNNCENLTVYSVFMPLLWRFKYWLIMTLIFLITGSLSALFIPYTFRQIIDASSTGFANINTEIIFLQLLFSFTVLSISAASREYFGQIFCCRLTNQLRQKLFEHILALSPSYMDNHYSSDIASHLNSDIKIINDNLFTLLSVGLRNFTIALGCTSLMFYTNPLISIVIVGVLAPLAFIASRLGRYSQFLSVDVQQQQAKIQQHVLEVSSFVKMVKAFNKDKDEALIMKENNRVYLENNEKKYRLFCLFIFAAMFSVFALIVTLLWYGSLLTKAGETSFAELIQFATYALINAIVLSGLADNWNKINELRGLVTNLMAILNKKVPIVTSSSNIVLLRENFSELRFENVYFRYNKSHSWILENINLSIKKNQKLAFVGLSGAGKSTLFRLLLRFYDVNLGRITLNGNDIRNIAVDNLRSFFAYLPQESPIFSRSIGENLAYAGDITEYQEIQKAAKAVNIEKLIEKMPLKYKTILGENAVNISAGEKQRIAIARTLLTKAPCLLLDEPTGALDSNNEAIIAKMLDKLAEKRTTIIIAHRLQSVQNADNIFLINNQRIENSGNHQQLRQKSKLYRDLVDKQFT